MEFPSQLTVTGVLTGVLTVMGSLAWNTAIVDIINNTFSGWSRTMTSIIYAIVVTILIVIVVYTFNFLSESTKTFFVGIDGVVRADVE